ncbi:MAG: hypothetical protein HZB09_02470 [Candidatus Yonathbacteria bacterium]|nr:hypothetical protein [Candidatus Yonathbacteria bacterium]
MNKTKGSILNSKHTSLDVPQVVSLRSPPEEDDVGEEVHENCVSVDTSDFLVSGVDLTDKSHDSSF